MVELRQNVVFVETTYGAVLLDEQAGEYWSLNPTGALTLRVLLDGGDTDRVVNEITDSFLVNRTTASLDVANLLTELRAAGLLAV